MLSFIPVVMSKPPLPSFLISSFHLPCSLLLRQVPPACHSPQQTRHCRADLPNLLRCTPSLVWLFLFPSFSPRLPRIHLFAAVAIAFGMRIVERTGKTETHPTAPGRKRSRETTAKLEKSKEYS